METAKSRIQTKETDKGHPGVQAQETERNLTDLPASVVGQPGDLHAVGRSARAGRGALVSATETFPLAVSAGELNGEALSHEVGPILIQSVRISEGCSQGDGL